MKKMNNKTNLKSIAELRGLKISLPLNLWVSDLIVNSTVPYEACGLNRTILNKGAIDFPKH